ncbi:MAG: SpoIIE family protein phosphatase [Acidobacteriota bacterium]|nr:SpoIIE family protein phosphatase [Acidobacteriota bacterium]
MTTQEAQATPLHRRLPSGLAGAAFWLAVWFCLLFVRYWIHGGFGSFLFVLQLFVGLALVSVALPLMLKLVRQHMLWSLRNKLVLTYLLIGLAPVILFVTLVLISGYIAAGQFAIHLVDTRLQAELTLMRGEAVHHADIVAHALDSQLAPGTTEDSERGDPLDSPRLHLRRDTVAYLDGVSIALGKDTHGKIPLGLPAWATELKSGGFHNLVSDGGDLYLVAISQQRLNNGRMLTLLTSMPVTQQLMNFVASGLGIARIQPTGAPTGTARREARTQPGIQPGVKNTPAGESAAKGSDAVGESGSAWITGGTQPPPVNLADVGVIFTSTETTTDWTTGERGDALVAVNSRPSLLYGQLFGGSLGGIVTSVLRIALILLCALFALIELLALWMAIRLSRTITQSVTDLYTATQHIDHGDFDHRIGVKRDDQLAELSRSFNTMTGSLQRLLVEQKEKERLQNEISIAQEVQANLFPLTSHGLEHLELHGVCRPARSVSGDYYDFLVFHEEAHDGVATRRETGVGIAIGDISGKGISAALLMATLHSAVRAYRFASEELIYSESTVAGLTASREDRGDCDELFQSPGRILALLNRHLYRSTQPEKYATLFLAHYDARTAMLTYSNAGQLPPLVLSRNGSVRRLDKGGTVVGLMDGMHYDEDRFHMESGDILVAYSDGVTEPENDFGEFGEERMMEVVSQYRDHPLHVISTQVMLALDAWIGAEEQPDDITLVLARQA